MSRTQQLKKESRRRRAMIAGGVAFAALASGILYLMMVDFPVRPELVQREIRVVPARVE